MKLKNKKLRIAFSLAIIVIAGVGYLLNQPWLYTVAIGVSLVGVLVVNDKR